MYFDYLLIDNKNFVPSATFIENIGLVRNLGPYSRLDIFYDNVMGLMLLEKSKYYARKYHICALYETI